MKLQNSTDTRLRHKTSTPAQVEVSMKTHVTKGVHNCLTLCNIIEAIRDNFNWSFKKNPDRLVHCKRNNIKKLVENISARSIEASGGDKLQNYLTTIIK